MDCPDRTACRKAMELFRVAEKYCLAIPSLVRSELRALRARPVRTWVVPARGRTGESAHLPRRPPAARSTTAAVPQPSRRSTRIHRTACRKAMELFRVAEKYCFDFNSCRNQTGGWRKLAAGEEREGGGPSTPRGFALVRAPGRAFRPEAGHVNPRMPCAGRRLRVRPRLPPPSPGGVQRGFTGLPAERQARQCRVKSAE